MSAKKRGAAPKTAKPALSFDGKEIHEGSPLYSAFARLSAMDERELAGASFLMEMLAFAGTAAKKLTQVQSQLDRIEGRILDLSKNGQVTTPEPAKSARDKAEKPATKPARKPSKTAKSTVAKELAEMEETVEQRQARMAKMEKDDKRKELALKKKQEALKAKSEKEAPKELNDAATGAKDEKPEPKKKPRRRRKPAKKAPAKETPGES